MRKISPLLIIFVASTLIASNISPELQKIISLANPNEYIPITIIVKEKVSREKLEKFSYYPKPERRKKIIEYLKQETPKYTSPIINEIKDDKNSYKNLNELFITSVVVVDAKPDLIKRLTRLDDIEWIYFRKKVPAIIESITPFDILEISWGIRQIKANLVWNNYGVKGEDVLIAIIDTGVDYHHPSLIKRVWRNPGEIPWNGVDDDGNGYIDDTYGWDFSGRTANPTDQKGHGTFVCGIACGDSIGGNIIGTAPKARFVSVKVLDRTGSGEENWAWEGIQYALIVGADVANLSIGWRNSEPHARGVWRNIIDNSMEAGMVVVVGAGNEGDEENAPYSIRTPGDVPRAITVGATTGSDAVADFSSVGPVTWADVPPYYDYPYPPGLLKPDITAPGVNIFSSVLGGDFQSGWNGTSMATPFVSGTVALIIQANPDLSPDSIKTLLELTADDIYVRGPDTLSGYGRINALRAVETAMGNSFGTISVTIYPQAKTIITDSRRRFTIDETSSFTIDLQAPMEYQAILSAYGFFPETLLFTLSPGTTITRNITLRPRPLHNVRFEIRDFDTGELVAQSFIEFMGSRYECSPGNPGVVNFALPENDSVEIFFGAPGYILSKMVISYTSRRKTIFIHKSIDFESESLFTPTAGVDWQWGAPSYSDGPESCRSGTRCWGTNLRGVYANSANSWLLTPTFTASEVDSPLVAFWHWYDLEATSNGWWDGGNVWVSVDESPFEIISPVDGYPGVIDSFNTILGGFQAFSGEIVGRKWHQVEFDLSRFSYGRRFAFIFRLGSDNNTPRAGWYIDDFAFIPRTKRAPIMFHSPPGDSVEPPILFAIRAIPVSSELDLSSIKMHIFADTTETTITLHPVEDFNDSFEVVFVPTAFYTGRTIRYYFESRDTDGRRSKLPQNAPDSLFSLYIKDDITPPEIGIVYMPVYAFSCASAFRIIIRAYDLSGIDTTTLAVWYKLNSGALLLSRNYTILDSANLFQIILPNTETRAHRVDFYIECSDNAIRRNYRRYPETGYLSCFPLDSIYWDFQAEPHGWSSGIWGWGEPDPSFVPVEPGERVWETSLNSNYPNLNSSLLYLDEVDLYGIIDISFSFDHLCFFDGVEPYPDGGDIWVYTSDGEQNKIHPLNGYDGVSSGTNPFFDGDSVFGGMHLWRHVYGELNEFAGKRISFVFRFASDSTGTDRGWFIDNFTLTPLNIGIQSNEKRELEFSLEGPFPNPSNTSLRFVVHYKEAGNIFIKAFDILGKIVHFEERKVNKGATEIVIDCSRFCSGVYLFSIESKYERHLRKSVILK